MNLSGFDLNLLRVLDALLRENSTVRAGVRIGLSQPAVSAALSRLRNALGDPLFVRRGQGLEPTDFARRIALPLRESLEGIETLLSEPLNFDPSLAEDSFKISGSDFFAEMLMPELASRLSARAPYMRVQLVDLVPDNYVETLEQYQVDLALIPKTGLPEWVDSRAVFRSGFVVIAQKEHPRLGRAGVRPGGTIPIDLFCDLGHVLFSPEGKIQGLGDAALAKVGRERRVVMTLPVFSGVYRAVSESELVALLPTQLARRIGLRNGLDIFAPPMPMPMAQIVMIWHKRSSANPAHRWLRNEIAQVLSKLDEGVTNLDAAVERP